MYSGPGRNMNQNRKFDNACFLDHCQDLGSYMVTDTKHGFLRTRLM